MTMRLPRQPTAVELEGEVPVRFSHNGSILKVRDHIGHWRVGDSKATTWRLEARGGVVYDLVEENGEWRIERLWD